MQSTSIVIGMIGIESSDYSDIFLSWSLNSITLAVRYIIQQQVFTVKSSTKKNMYTKYIQRFSGNTYKNKFPQSCVYKSVSKGDHGISIWQKKQSKRNVWMW
jgi:hypothetical protein